MATPTRVGQAVMRIATGSIGIITEPLRKSGPNKGKLAAIFVGAHYEVSVDPGDLEVVELIASTSEVKP